MTEKKNTIDIQRKYAQEAERVVGVYRAVEKILSIVCNVKTVDINKESKLKEDLGMDNSDIFWIVQGIEIECNVKLTTSELANQIITVEDIVNSIFQKMKKKEKRCLKWEVF